jgi:excisionase family DNA binding protein
MSSRLLTIQEAAELLKLHPETLRRWDNNGRLPAIKVGERNDRRYREDDILNFLKTQKTQSSYKGYQIMPDTYGFDRFSNRFGSIARYIVWNDDGVTIFAFAIAGLEWFAVPHIKENQMVNKAEKAIRTTIDNGAIEFHKDYTFEFDARSEEFIPKTNPEWWEEFGRQR